MVELNKHTEVLADRQYLRTRKVVARHEDTTYYIGRIMCRMHLHKGCGY